jgi:hypothetical protein
MPGWLGRPKAQHIADDLIKRDKTFSCHKTTGVAGGPKGIEQSQCAGALIMLHKSAKLNDNWLFRLAQMSDMLDVKRLDLKAPVFNTSHDFTAHHDHDNFATEPAEASPETHEG